MKTIGERAIEYATITDPLRPGDAPRIAMRVDECLAEAFIGGAISERAELTRWNDPKEPPECGTEVLVKYSDGRVFMARYENSEFGWACYEPRGEMTYGVKDGVIVGWRPIHE